MPDRTRLYEIYDDYTMLVSRTKNRPRWAELDPLHTTGFGSIRSPFTVALILAGFFYGGLHLLAWNREFRSPIEELIWKISSLAIAGSGLAYLAFAIFVNFYRVYIHLSGTLAVLFDYCILLAVFSGIALYFFCRVFIIVESFLDAFHLPESAFMVPNWSQYFPHLG